MNLSFLDSGNPDVDAGPTVDASFADAAVETSTAVEAEADVADVGDSGSGSSAPYFGDGGNLIVNPSCDPSTLDWQTVAQTPLDTSTTYVYMGDGASCHSSGRTHSFAQTYDPNSGYDGPLQDVTDVVVPGHYYSFSAWALWAPPLADGGPVDAGALDAGTQAVYAVVEVMCGGDAGIQPPTAAGNIYTPLATVTSVPEGTWVQLVSTGPGFEVPTGCAPLDVRVYIAGPDPGYDLYTDEATLLFVQ